MTKTVAWNGGGWQVYSGCPDPDKAVDLTGYIEALGRLRLWAGAPSYRTLAKRVGPMLRPPRSVAQSTIADVFKAGRRRLDLDLVVAIVRALGLDGAEAARWRDACVRVHASGKAAGSDGVLRQLPADSSVFTGRRAELETIMRAAGSAADAVTIVAIEGMPGVGKTRLALHAAHTLVKSGRFGDVQLYADLHGFDADNPPADPAAVLGGFLHVLGVPGGLVPDSLPDSLEDRAAAFRSALVGRPALIVLDNAADEKQISHLIPGVSGALVLVTSRRTMAGLDNVVTVPLDVLSPAESRALLARTAGADRIAGEPEAAGAVGEACGHLPLAVGLAGARLKTRPAWSVAELLAELQTAGLAAMTVGRRSVLPVFDASLKELGPSSRRLFLLLGLCPGNDVGAESAAALAGTTPEIARELLEALCDEGLVRTRTVGRFQLHHLLRGYAAHRARQEFSEAQRWGALRSVLGWYTMRMQDSVMHRPATARRLLARVPALAEGDGRALGAAWCAVGDAHYLSGEFAFADTSYHRALKLGGVASAGSFATSPHLMVPRRRLEAATE